MSVISIIIALLLGLFNALVIQYLVSEWRKGGHMKYLLQFSKDGYFYEQLTFWCLPLLFAILLFYLMGWVLVNL